MAVGERGQSPLPADLPAAERAFFEELRRLAALGGLSQRDLEGLTAAAGRSAFFGKSSWARALKGETRPPLQAVRALVAHLGGGVGAEALPDLWARAFAPPPRREPCTAPLPCQLPPAVPHFTGRTTAIQALDQLAGETAAAGGTLAISAIGGTAGVGKTALAVHWAHRIASRFPDGQLYVNLRGYDPSGDPVEPAEAIQGFLEALGVPAERLPAGPQAQAGLYRSLLAGKQMLIVLDNARDPGQVRPLLPGAAGCLVLVTSRSQLTGLAAADGARLITLDLLGEDEARALLTRRLGSGRVAAEPEATGALITLCAGLPLAVNIAAARAAAQPGLPLAELAAGLRGESSRLDALDTGEPATSVRAVFSWSYQSLPEPTARMFRLLSLHPGPDITAAAAASLAGVPAGHATGILRDLAAAHLIAEHAPARFTFHDLLRVYAAEQAAASDTESGRRAAAGRMLDHYLHTAHSCAALLCPGRELLSLAPPEPGVTPETHDDIGAALAWFAAERRVLAAAITRAADTDSAAAAWRLGWTFGRFLHRTGYRQEWLATLRTSLAAAESAADLTGLALVHRDLGGAYADQGSCQEADVHLWRAMGLFELLGDVSGQAHTHLYLGRMLEVQGRARETLAHGLQALQLFRSAGHTAGQANALTNAALVHCALGEHEKALACCQQALPLHRQSGNRDAEGYAWACLGDTYHHLGQHKKAIECDQRSAALFRELGAGPLLAWALTQLGDHLLASGHPQDARAPWQQALAILDDLQHPDAEQVRARLSRAVLAAAVRA